MEYYLAIKMRNNWTSRSWDVLRDAGKGEVLGAGEGLQELYLILKPNWLSPLFFPLYKFNTLSFVDNKGVEK